MSGGPPQDPAGPAGATLADRLRPGLARAQRESRVPGLTAAVGSGGGLLAEYAAGEPPPAPDVAFRIGSITKTFTAVLVMQLRDAGRLHLDDPLEAHLPGTPVGGLLLRDLLGHASGLTREPPGEFWEAVPGVEGAALVAGLRDEDRVLPPRSAWHYSNLAFGLLGQVVERAHAGAFRDVLRDRLLDPLALRRTTWLPSPPHAVGYRVHPYTGVLREEPVTDTAAMGPAGQLWSTPSDLVRWGAFLAAPDDTLLHPDTAAEMCHPVSIRDETWTVGWGLGLQLFRRSVGGAERLLVGHGGSMPGFVAGLAVDRGEGVAAAVMGNAWWSADTNALAGDAVVAAVEEPTRTPRAWAPSDPAPAELAALTGAWFYRGAPCLAVLVDGQLHVRAATDVAGLRADAYVPVGPDLLRGVRGGNAGELLRVLRDDAGRAVLLEVATWRYVRDPDDPRGGP